MEIERLKEVMKEKRSTTSDYHARLGRFWRISEERDKLHAPLAYAAFEFRIAMERALLELLYLIKDHHLSKKELEYDFWQLKKALYKTQGQSKDGKEKLQRRLEFNSLYAKSLPQPFQPTNKKVAIIDIEKINKFWEKLSRYCHRQLKANNSWGDIRWVNKGYELLNEVESYVWEIMVDCQVAWVKPDTIPKQIEEQAKMFIVKSLVVHA